MQVSNKQKQPKSTDTLDTITKLLASYVSYKRHFFRGFLYGMGGFFGATLGVAITLGIFSWSLSRLQVVPIIGDFATEIVEFVQTNLANKTNTNSVTPLHIAE